MQVFSADHADTAWRQAARALLDRRAALVGSRIGEARELLHVALSVADPRQRWVVSRIPPLNPAFALAEIIWIMAGRNDTRFLSHWFPDYPRYVGGEGRQHAAYGHRLRRHFGLDQLRRAYEALRSNDESRQVALQIWSPTDDLPSEDGSPRSGDVPCNLTSTLKVREGKLHWLQVLRSNDVDRGLPHNLVQFTTLQDVMAGWLGVDLGRYTHVIDSLHLYTEASARLAIDEQVVPAINADRFDQPVDQSLRVFGELATRMDVLVEAGPAAVPPQDLDEATELPPAYRNMWAIILADAARRAGDHEQAAQLARGCNNPALRQLWERWTQRTNKQTGP